MTPAMFVETLENFRKERIFSGSHVVPLGGFDWLFVFHLVFTPIPSLSAFMAWPNLGLNQNGELLGETSNETHSYLPSQNGQ